MPADRRGSRDKSAHHQHSVPQTAAASAVNHHSSSNRPAAGQPSSPANHASAAAASSRSQGLMSNALAGFGAAAAGSQNKPKTGPIRDATAVLYHMSNFPVIFPSLLEALGWP